ncbi:hypothetical protein V8G54_014103 [Vigna mungo]|uniref:Uncharacterized protein n=1 Tax=Vigna mungo TaxID=3915 RepID=A0AAQ3RYA8_VIGMU
MDCPASAMQRQGCRDAPHQSQFLLAWRTALLSWVGFPRKPSVMRIELFSRTFDSSSSLCIAAPSLHDPSHTTASPLALHLLLTNQFHSIPNCSDQTSTTSPTRCSRPAPLQHQAMTTKPVT